MARPIDERVEMLESQIQYLYDKLGYTLNESEEEDDPPKKRLREYRIKADKLPEYKNNKKMSHCLWLAGEDEDDDWNWTANEGGAVRLPRDTAFDIFDGVKVPECYGPAYVVDEQGNNA